ncbi:MAG: DegT/DnrJ/EryC1/StrS family aminotransferase [Nitrospirae bacterium]|nr:DegT/DnrJ/EryC1/StrS family aminotransferase [Nitrospirota bacterium]
MKSIKPFKNPIYITRPIFPELDAYTMRLKEVWESQKLTNNGDMHKLLERTLRQELKVPFLSLFNNGTIALLTACKTLGLKGEVITTPFTFPATPHALAWNNITPVFCDITSSTMNIDASKIEELITPRTTGILAVHVFGVPCDVKNIQNIADRYGLKVVYDAAHAFGVEIDGNGIGNYGDISMFSFHATKLFHTAEGGALTFSNERFKEKVDLLKNFGIRNEEEVVDVGINGKMNELQAALGLEVLSCIGEEQNKRKYLSDVYRELLSGCDGLTLPPENISDVTMSNQYFVVRIDKDLFGCSRDRVYEELKKYNVFARKYFYPLCSNYACYRDNKSSSVINLPYANRISLEVLSLPLYGALTAGDIEKICGIMTNAKK